MFKIAINRDQSDNYKAITLSFNKGTMLFKIKRLSLRSRFELLNICIRVVTIEERKKWSCKQIRGKINCN